jgi:hypothetical protein
MRFDEVWMSSQQLYALAQLAKSTAGLKGEVIEVGVWQGLSTIELMHAIYPDNLHAVDHWLGDSNTDGQGITREWAESRDNYSIFLANMWEATRGNVIIHKQDWREFWGTWTQPVRFMHIDATHTADEVADNIEAFLPYAVGGAVFCGDDYDWPGVVEGVQRQFGTSHTVVGKLWYKRI